jgi:hypothetical protein
MQIVDIKRHSP